MIRALGIAVAAILFTSCGSDTPVAPSPLVGSVVGRTSNPDLFVGAATSDGKATVYLCDGVSIGEWFSGSLDGTGRLVASSREGSQLDAVLRAPGVQGTVKFLVGTARLSPELGGAVVSFSASQPAEGVAGLYVAVTREAGAVTQLGGWVVLPDGQRGVFINPRPPRRILPSPSLNTTTLTVLGPDGVPVQAVKVTGFVGNDIKP